MLAMRKKPYENDRKKNCMGRRQFTTIFDKKKSLVVSGKSLVKNIESVKICGKMKTESSPALQAAPSRVGYVTAREAIRSEKLKMKSEKSVKSVAITSVNLSVLSVSVVSIWFFLVKRLRCKELFIFAKVLS